MGIGTKVMAGAITAAVLAAATPSAFAAAEFVADFCEIRKDTTIDHKIYVKGSKYRLDLSQRRGKSILIVDQDKGVTTVCQEWRKVYNYVPSDAGTSLMNDPIQALQHTARNFPRISRGKEIVNGLECDKYVYLNYDSTEFLIEWYSPQLDFPVKAQSLKVGTNEKTNELRYVILGPVDDRMFQVPADYVRYQDQLLRLPEWEEKAASARVIELPFQGSLAAGEIVKAKIQPGKTIVVQGQIEKGGQTDASAVPFKNGKPAIDVQAFRIYSLGGGNWVPIEQTIDEADEVVIGDSKGPVTIDVRLNDSFEKVVAAGEEFRVPLTADMQTNMRLVNLGQSEATCRWTYYRDGQPLSDADSQPAKFRWWTLPDPGEAHFRPIYAHGNELVYKVEKGPMRIKLDQYDSKKY